MFQQYVVGTFATDFLLGVCWKQFPFTKCFISGGNIVPAQFISPAVPRAKLTAHFTI